MRHGLNIVAIGGGTGLSTLLRGLKVYVGADAPSSIARLGATLEDGTVLAGEVEISGSYLGEKVNMEPRHARITHLAIEPSDAAPVQRAIDALRDADMILIGPGSLYTSVLPNLLIREIGDAIRAARALRVYICNVMTQPGETD